MCLKNKYYPLVQLSNGKRKILFNRGVTIDSRDDYEEFLSIQSFEKKWIDDFNNALIHDDSFDKLDDSTFFDVETGEIMYISKFIKMVSVPCGMCRECLTQRAREWSFRIMKECEIHDDNWFITFTYDDEHLPSDKMLDVNAIKDFNKKLKVYLNRKGLDSSFRFYGVGEYGGQTARPHYHVIYFGLPIPDLKFAHKTPEGNLLFDSDFIKSVWSKGFITIEGVSIGSAAYVARYCDKKKRLNKLQKLDLMKKGIVPEFSRMSNRPGIGSWYLDTAIEKFNDGIFNSYINGKSYSFPLYYNKKIKEICADTPELEKYESDAKIKSSMKIANNLNLSDSVGSLYHYNDFVDKEYKSNRKL